ASSAAPLSPIAPLLCTRKTKTLHDDMPEHGMYVLRNLHVIHIDPNHMLGDLPERSSAISAKP
ncbi:hypothetical protein, partial [Mesorhizobium sp.]|uniref:hypothetical protein n=1 Tax=Mesorhizobium sp. TaxID=1871066 RepID=UPI0025D0DC8C